MKKLIGILFSVLLVTACNHKKEEPTDVVNEPTHFQGEAYGSTFSIIYYGEGENYNDDIQEILDAFDQSVNTYRNDSKLSVFNESDFSSPADEMLLELVDMSKDLNILSNGYFDPSVEPLSDLWGFSSAGPKNKPTQHKVDSVMQFIGMEHIKVLNDSLVKDDARVRLSFNSITGYVNDKIAAFFNQKNVDNYLIEIGGEIYAHGKKPNETPWKVGVDEPVDNGAREVNTVVELHNEGLATSGNYRKFQIDEESGEKYVHTINPITGEAKPSELLSATVIAPTTAEADAMATALMAMGYNLTIEFIKAHPELKFYIIWQDESGNLQHEAFNGFEYQNIE